jgi:hypothetical protein
MPCLDTHKHDIDRSNRCRIVARLRRLDHEISFDALDSQTVGPNRFEVITASNKHHVLASLRQPAAKISTHTSGSEYSNPHFVPHYVISIGS